jgi:hypothetical protein
MFQDEGTYKVNDNGRAECEETQVDEIHTNAGGFDA